MVTETEKLLAANIQVVEISDVHDDLSWTVDETKILTFTAVYQQGKTLGTPILQRVWEGHGRWYYRIIDGFHRFRAMVAAGITEFAAVIRHCDDRTAEMERIQASLDKPDEILTKRAIAALKAIFVREMADALGANDLYTMELISDAPGKEITKRRGDLPRDPLLALLAFYNHMVATRNMVSKPDDRSPLKRGEWINSPGFDLKESGWERNIIDKLTEFTGLFGRDLNWFTKLLGIEMVLQTNRSASIWPLIRDVGDEQVQLLLLRRLPREAEITTIEFCQALHVLGVRPASNEARPFFKFEARSVVLQSLVTSTLWDLCSAYRTAENTYWKQVRREEEKAKEEALKRLQIVPGIVMDTSTGTLVRPSSPKAGRVVNDEVAISSRRRQALIRKFRQAVQAFMQAGNAYDAEDGEWSRPVLQNDLAKVADWVGARIKKD